jgi:hypothetical protein
MSTPSEESSAAWLSDDLTHKTRDHGEKQTQPGIGKNDPICAPDMPRRARQSGASGHNVTNDPEVMAYAPKRVREAAARAGTERELPEIPGCPDELPRRSAHVAEADIGHGANERALDPKDVASLQPSYPSDEQECAQPSSGRSKADDADLQRIEASLRWLRRVQAADTRLPRAANLTAPAPRSSDASGRRENVPGAIRSPLSSLEPTRLMPPPSRTDRYSNTMLAISIACTFLAAIVYWWMQADQSVSSAVSTAIPAPQLASVAAPSSADNAADREQGSQPERPLPVSLETKADEVAEAQSLSQAPIAPQTAGAALPAATASSTATGPDIAPTGKPLRTLSVEEVALLVEQGKNYIAAGDVVTARMIFRRAAQAGDATAALALAATYDPMVLAKLGVMGMGADVEKARAWYQIAESYGSAEATQRLQVLGKQ